VYSFELKPFLFFICVYINYVFVCGLGWQNNNKKERRKIKTKLFVSFFSLSLFLSLSLFELCVGLFVLFIFS